MCFKPNSLNGLFVPTLCLSDVPLTFVTSKKYLGVHHQDDDDIMRYVKSLYSRGNMLINRFKTCSSSIKVKLFRSFLCNAYVCHLWSTYKQYTYKRIVVAFNNIYRILFGILKGESMSSIYVYNNVDSFGVLVCKNFIVLKHNV